jgi:multidrug resistance protein, MATE family
MNLIRRITATLRNQHDLYQLWRLAFPIMIGFISFNIVGLVDTAMVASLGIQALAAVGLAQVIAACCGAVLIGLSAGVQAIVARRKGEQQLDGMLTGLSAGVVVGLLVATLLLVFLYPLIPALLARLNNDATVVGLATPYLEWRMLTFPVMSISIAFGAFWNAIGKSTYYMVTIIVMNVTNVLFNYLLIFGHWGAPAMGVTGAAVATGVAIVVCAIVHLLLYFYITRNQRVRWVWPTVPVLRRITSLSLPASFNALQDSTVLAITVWIIGHIGTREMGIVNILFNVMAVAMLPAMALGTATGSLVGQSLGQKHSGKARQWGWLALATGCLLSAFTAVPVFLFPELFLRLFIHDTAVMQSAIAPAQITAAAIVLKNISFILKHALYGAGESARVMRTVLTIQWLVIIPGIAWFGLWQQSGFLVIWGLFTIGESLLSATALLCIWYRSQWIDSAYSRLT